MNYKRKNPQSTNMMFIETQSATNWTENTLKLEWGNKITTICRQECIDRNFNRITKTKEGNIQAVS